MSSTLEGFVSIVRETLGDPQMPLTPQTVVADVPGWASMAMVNMILAVEVRFGIRVRSRDIDHIVRIGDMVKMVEGKQRR